MPAPRRWRLRSMPRPGGLYWLLESGRNEGRTTLSLKYVSADEATRALATMQTEEDGGTIGRVFELHRDNPSAAVRYLVGDPGVAALLPAPRVDYGAMTLVEYFDGVFWPARIDPSSTVGVAAATATAELGYWRHKGGHDGKGERRGILDGELGSTRLRDLTDQAWERWQEAQAHLSGRAKALRRAAYAALLTYARRMGHTSYRPEFFRIRGATKRTREQSDPLDLDEVRALLDASDPMRRAMWAVGIGQGLRPGELVRVCWEDVDWTDHVLRVRGTKTEESAARIPMTPLAYSELRAHWVRQGQPTEGPCFLYGGRGVEREPPQPRPFVQFKKALASDARAAGIARRVYPYLLRHSFATIAWSLGIDRDVARRVLRHTDLAMLDQVYCRPRPVDLVERVAGFHVG